MMMRPLQTQLGVLDAIERRRSVRSFKEETLAAPAVRALLRAAVLAPTARHLEPWAFAVIQDRALLKRLSDRAKSTWPPESTPLHERHEAAHLPAPTHFGAQHLAFADFNVFFNAGTLIIICAKPVGPFADADCWLAAENLMLAATEMQLGTCIIGSAIEALNLPDVKAELGIRPEIRIVAPIIVGVADGKVAATSRKEPVVLCWK